MDAFKSTAKRRGADDNPPNRFESVHCQPDFEHLEHEPPSDEPRVVPTQFLADTTRTLITSNDSPDVGFKWSINAYRGCEHGCAYCYARPSHEVFGMGAGLDFETKILVKHDAPKLLRDELCRPKWTGELIVMSGVTDCYQPAERRFRLTRGLLEVMLEARQPVAIITKNSLVLRDIDILSELAKLRLVHVNISLTTLDATLSRTMEPRTSLPEARLRAVHELTAAGVPVRVMTAPMVPGLNDVEIPTLLKAAAEAGRSMPAMSCFGCPWRCCRFLRRGSRGTIRSKRTTSSNSFDRHAAARKATANSVDVWSAKGLTPNRLARHFESSNISTV